MAPADGRDVEEPLGMTNKALRALGIAAVVSMVLFWAWILSGGPKKPNPDELDDRSYVTFAEQRCSRLRTDIEALPNALDATSAAERADTIEEANGLLREMVDDLEARAPTAGKDHKRLSGWLADWRTYEGDRERYVDALRQDPGARFNVTEHPDFSDPVDEVIRVFADVNGMPACRVPGDVG